MAKRLGGAERFANVTDKDIATLVADKDSKNMKKATKAAVRVFENYLKAKNICCKFATATPTELNLLQVRNCNTNKTQYKFRIIL